MDVFIIKSKEVIDRAVEHIRALPKEPQHEVVIRKKRKEKSAQQRNYFHKLCEIIGEHTGHGKEYIKLRIKYTTLELIEITTPRGLFYAPPSTENISREEYTNMIDAVLMIGYELGLKMPTPDYYGYTLERICDE